MTQDQLDELLMAAMEGRREGFNPHVHPDHLEWLCERARYARVADIGIKAVLDALDTLYKAAEQAVEVMGKLPDSKQATDAYAALVDALEKAKGEAA